TQLANTISDFDTQVRTNRLDQMAAPTGSLSLANQKIINLLDPAAAQDAATMGWVQNQLAGIASGQTLKGSVKVAVTGGNVVVANPGGSTIDGVPVVNGDVLLLTAQSTGSQN